MPCWGTLSTSHLLGHGRGNLGHSSLCSPSISWYSPPTPQYWQITKRCGHLDSMWPTRYWRSTISPHLLEHWTSSKSQPSLLPRWWIDDVVHPAIYNIFLCWYNTQDNSNGHKFPSWLGQDKICKTNGRNTHLEQTVRSSGVSTNLY